MNASRRRNVRIRRSFDDTSRDEPLLNELIRTSRLLMQAECSLTLAMCRECAINWGICAGREWRSLCVRPSLFRASPTLASHQLVQMIFQMLDIRCSSPVARLELLNKLNVLDQRHSSLFPDQTVEQ